MEVVTKEIGDTTYVLKLFPAMTGLDILSRLEKDGTAPSIIRDVITKGAKIGSVDITEAKFNTQFAGKYKEMMLLFAEILKYNNLFPDEGEEGNEEGSEE